LRANFKDDRRRIATRETGSRFCPYAPTSRDGGFIAERRTPTHAPSNVCPTISELLSQTKVIVHFNMFCSSMEYWIS
jgi:hypothetical protein